MLVREDEVAPDVVLLARDAVRLAADDLDLGVVPEIRWFEDARELPTEG